MKSYKTPETRQVQSLSIEKWHELGLQGDLIPVTICLEGDSMRPLIRRGLDRVTILPLSRPVQIGDIVLFHGGPGRYVVHRVHRLKNDMVQTLGDNCWNHDPWMPLTDVWGLVVRLERGGRVYRLDTPSARALGRIWMALHPVRRLYRRLRSAAGKCYRKIFPKGHAPEK